MLWVRVHTDAGVIGLGETFYGAGVSGIASARHAGDAAARQESAAYRGAPHREMTNLLMAGLDRRGVAGDLGGGHRALGPVRQGLAASRCTRC